MTGPRIHHVQQVRTIDSIARQYRVTSRAILERNEHLQTPMGGRRQVAPPEVITIPPQPVKKGNFNALTHGSQLRPVDYGYTWGHPTPYSFLLHLRTFGVIGRLYPEANFRILLTNFIDINGLRTSTTPFHPNRYVKLPHRNVGQ